MLKYSEVSIGKEYSRQTDEDNSKTFDTIEIVCAYEYMYNGQSC